MNAPSFNRLLQRRMLEIVLSEAFLFVTLGIFFPYLKVLKPTVPFAVFLMILQPMFAMNFTVLIKDWRRKLGMVIVILIIYSLFFPMLSWTFLKLFTMACGKPIVIAGAVLTTLAPVAMPVPIVVASLGGDVELSVISIIVTFMASLAVMPTWGYLILHKTIPVPVNKLIMAIVEYIILPLIAARIIRYLVENYSDYNKANSYLMTVSLLSMYYLVALIFALSARVIASMLLSVIVFIIMVNIYYLLRYGIAYAVGRAIKANTKELIALTFVGTANGALGMAVSLGAYGPAAAAGAVMAGPLGVMTTMSFVAKAFASRLSEQPSR